MTVTRLRDVARVPLGDDGRRSSTAFAAAVAAVPTAGAADPVRVERDRDLAHGGGGDVGGVLGAASAAAGAVCGGRAGRCWPSAGGCCSKWARGGRWRRWCGRTGRAAAGAVVVTSLRHAQETTPDGQRCGRRSGSCGWPACRSTGRPSPARRAAAFRFRAIRSSASVIGSTSLRRRLQPCSVERAELSDWFYTPTWGRIDKAGRGRETAASSRWLLFADADGIGAAVEAHLRGGGHDVVVVEAGDSYAFAPGKRASIDPANPEHYRALLKALRDEHQLPDVVGHFWGVTATPLSEEESSSDCQQRGFYSLLLLAQAIGEVGTGAAMRIAVVTTDLLHVTGTERLMPSKAPVLGAVPGDPARVPRTSGAASSIWWPTNGARATPRALPILPARWRPRASLLPRIAAASCGVPRRSRCHLGPIEASPARLRERGVYLLTGGFGGIGQTLAQYLAETVSARLVLIGRTPLAAARRMGRARRVATRDGCHLPADPAGSVARTRRRRSDGRGRGCRRRGGRPQSRRGRAGAFRRLNGDHPRRRHLAGRRHADEDPGSGSERARAEGRRDAGARGGGRGRRARFLRPLLVAGIGPRRRRPGRLPRRERLPRRVCRLLPAAHRRRRGVDQLGHLARRRHGRRHGDACRSRAPPCRAPRTRDDAGRGRRSLQACDRRRQPSAGTRLDASAPSRSGAGIGADDGGKRRPADALAPCAS